MRKLPAIDMIRRDDWLIETCRGKRVLHIGCTDYPITDYKVKNQKLLHFRLTQAASEVIGLDIDQAGLKVLSELMPEQKFILHSAEELDSCKALENQRFDVIVAADVVEHLSNIGLFLASAKKKLNAGGQLLITTPQSFAIKRMLAMILMGYEYVHPDHIAYFSVSTLSCLLSRYGLEIEQLYMFQWRNPTFKNWAANAFVMPALWLSRGHLCDEIALSAK
jgi:2-polyprenyl-3-methyl-5-hydroxy-6-metoxy-1,4-benzoquinol methylase